MTVGAQTVASRFADIVGASNVFADPAQLTPYEVDLKRPSAAVRPGTADEVARIIQVAAAEKLAVIPTGARTKLEIGLPPLRYDLALDLTRLDRIAAYDPGDLTLSVEAGCPVCRVQAALAEHGQFLPLAVPFLERSTVGGTIASGVDSPLRHGFGTSRDFVLGIEFVTGDGIASKSGGRVVKNVTGYDLHKLMIGSFGSLAVITKVNLRTFPRPIGSRGFIAHFPTGTAAFEMRRLIALSPVRPLTMEIFSPRVAAMLSNEIAAKLTKTRGAPVPLSNDLWSLTTGFAGNDAVRARCESELARMAQEAGASDVSVLSDELSHAWNRKREFIPIALASFPSATVLKISTVPNRVVNALDQAARAAESSGLTWLAMARGVGVLYFVMFPPESEDSAVSAGAEWRIRAATVARKISLDVQRLGGNFSIPWCPVEWKPALSEWIWGPASPDFAQMRKLKSAFDPLGILSPGRFVGGL
jgi:glycolate dehydrogenase FAD-binding subunit